MLVAAALSNRRALPALLLLSLAALSSHAWDLEPHSRPHGHGARRRARGLRNPEQYEEYVVQFASAASDVDAFCEERAAAGRPCRQRFKLVLLGCSVELTPPEVAAARADPRVRDVHANDGVRAFQAPPLPTLPLAAEASGTGGLQAGAPWNLNRISHPGLPLTTGFKYGSDGSGVNAYVLDTGIRLDHEEFLYSSEDRARGLTGSRAHAGFSSFGDGDSEDCFGHGTHVAGILGGLTYGVAKNATLHSVRCIDCNGDSAVDDIIAGLEWVAANAQRPAVASLSLGTSFVNDALDAALLALIDLGITAVVAAGNFGSDACDLSPARLPQCIAVAASDSSDTRWSGSNYGSCVDLYAPGVAITSAMFTSPTAAISATGTSMACPHVSGVAAQYLQLNPQALPAQVQAFITGNSARKKINAALEVNGTPNLLLQEALPAVQAASVEPPVLGPVVAFQDKTSIIQAQMLTLRSTTNVSITFKAGSIDAGQTWVAAYPDGGTLRAGQTREISLEYDASQLPQQGRYNTDVLVSMSKQPYAQAYAATLLLFCPELSEVRQSQLPQTVDASFAKLQDGPSPLSGAPGAAPDWTAAAAAACPTCIFAELKLRFSHPVAVLPLAALTLDDSSAAIRLINSTGPRGPLCSDFTVRVTVPFSPWQTQNTTVCVGINGALVADVDGNTFPNVTACQTVDHRPRGTFLSTLPSSSYSGGPVTGSASPQLLLAFTEPVAGLAAGSFNVSGPGLDASAARVLAAGPAGGGGMATFAYTLQLEVPSDYVGPVTVALADPVMDAAQQANFPVMPHGFVKLAERDFVFGVLPAAAYTGGSVQST